MSNIRDLGQKIHSLQNMQKVMRAMNMISSIKLRKLYTIQSPLALFNHSVDEICATIHSAVFDSRNPVVAGYHDIRRCHVIMFTSDKGLCGTHNSSVQKAVEELMKTNEDAGIPVDFTCIGNKGANYCKRREYKVFQQAQINERVFTKKQLQTLSSAIFDRYTNNEIQKVYAVSNMFYSTLRHETVTLQLLPLFIPEQEGVTGPGMITEPGGDDFVQSAGKLYFSYKLRSILLNSYLSEHSSRMTAMENATNNSEDLINKYIAMENHARQAAITDELIEIVSGKEALKK